MSRASQHLPFEYTRGMRLYAAPVAQALLPVIDMALCRREAPLRLIFRAEAPSSRLRGSVSTVWYRVNAEGTQCGSEVSCEPHPPAHRIR